MNARTVMRDIIAKRVEQATAVPQHWLARHWREIASMTTVMAEIYEAEHEAKAADKVKAGRG